MNNFRYLPLPNFSSRICDLHPDIEELTGLVLLKQEKRVVTSAKNPLKPLHVFGMIIRDSEMDFIFVTCWGSKEYIDQLVNKIEIQSIIRIKNPLVKIKNFETDDDLFRPWTTSQFCLVLNEPIGLVEMVDESFRPDLIQLKSVPIRDHNDFYSLEDITSDEKNKINQDVNILFCIREIKPVQEIKNRNGLLRHKLELVIFDDTKDYFILNIWDKELIKFASSWLIKKTVIFAIDLKLFYNQYSKSLEASTTSKTIFTVNPDINEGYSLYKFAINCHLAETLPLLDQIKNKAIKTNIENLKKNLSQAFISEYVLVEAVITSFDIDSDSSIFSFKCKRCNLDVNFVSKKCPNQNCKTLNIGYTKLVNKSLNVSDHTSSLDGVRINAKLFETIIGMTIEEFIKLDEAAKTRIKWLFLFERKRLLIKVTCQSSENDSEAFLKYYFKLINMDEMYQN